MCAFECLVNMIVDAAIRLLQLNIINFIVFSISISVSTVVIIQINSLDVLTIFCSYKAPCRDGRL